MAAEPEILAKKYAEQFKKAPPGDILAYFLQTYKGKIVQATSMGPEDQVITHMIWSIDKNTRIITLDTGRLFQETYNLIGKTNEKYNINIEILFPDYKEVEKMVRERGINLFYESIENRRLCCHIRKNESMKRGLKDMEVWICGLRKDQTLTRFYNKAVEWDEQYSLIKVNPLINWTEKQVWESLREHKIPYNILHDKGFPSIGCQPCTRAVKPGENSRAGRWWWEKSEPKECGLHNKETD